VAVTRADLTPSVERLLARLDTATNIRGCEALCQAVKEALCDAILAGDLELPPGCTREDPQRYARHLLHKDPADRYAVVVMVWATGQGTPIHDHDGKWCVECVYEGRIQVTSYDLDGDPGDTEVGFEQQTDVTAGRGAAGALIPPFDYHVIANRETETAVTIHVYGGEMQGCHCYVPTSAGRYRRERRDLTYSSS
jgi:predicted metal-dependent enzyme (double-stranded beta helix superfamily)